jgi:hypothetical protein
VQALGGRVVVECQTPLLNLLARSPGIEELVAAGTALPSFDVHAPLLSLPLLFNTTAATIPMAVPYVFADPALEQQWGRELNRMAGLKVGICWQGNPKHPKDRLRSIPLETFAVLSGVAGIRLVSLQVGPGREQLVTSPNGFAITDLGSRFDTSSFVDAAAAIKHLDLVITVDTALAHLAGAMGAPCWIGLHFVPDWRWQLGRVDSPWYPRVRLFRQTTPGDWKSVLARMAAELASSVKPL